MLCSGPDSGLGLRQEFSHLDAVSAFGIPDAKNSEPTGCLCGQVIQGKAVPTDCRLFGSRCSPDHPIGPCMVSSEGTCAAYLKYEGSNR